MSFWKKLFGGESKPQPPPSKPQSQPATAAPADNKKLLEACEKQNWSEAQRLIAIGADATFCDSSGFTPLHYAAMNGDAETARLLIGKGANVNAQTRMLRQTPLDQARNNNKHELVSLLAANGGKSLQIG